MEISLCVLFIIYLAVYVCQQLCLFLLLVDCRPTEWRCALTHSANSVDTVHGAPTRAWMKQNAAENRTNPKSILRRYRAVNALKFSFEYTLSLCVLDFNFRCVLIIVYKNTNKWALLQITSVSVYRVTKGHVLKPLYDCCCYHQTRFPFLFRTSSAHPSFMLVSYNIPYMRTIFLVWNLWLKICRAAATVKLKWIKKKKGLPKAAVTGTASKLQR